MDSVGLAIVIILVIILILLLASAFCGAQKRAYRRGQRSSLGPRAHATASPRELSNVGGAADDEDDEASTNVLSSCGGGVGLLAPLLALAAVPAISSDVTAVQNNSSLDVDVKISNSETAAYSNVAPGDAVTDITLPADQAWTISVTKSGGEQTNDAIAVSYSPSGDGVSGASIDISSIGALQGAFVDEDDGSTSFVISNQNGLSNLAALSALSLL